jgi:uncharacterized protein YdaL
VKTKILATLTFLLFGLWLIRTETVDAIEENVTKVDPNTKVLVVYSSEKGEMDEHQRLLDLSLGHFSENIEYESSEAVELEDLADQTHLIYYGQAEEELSSNVSEVFSSFTGPTLAIGYNVEQLGEKYSFLQVGEDKTVTELEYLGDAEKTRTIGPNTVFETTLDEEAEILVRGSGDQGVFPLIMHRDKNYYMASDSLLLPYSVYFSQALNDFFGTETIDQTPAYIRLEDVHPLTDAKNLMAVAEELARRNIPYMVATIPVYTDPDTGRVYHFEDSPKVLEALRYMQDNGGSVVLHGYTHQFRGSETGEGFEFWDVEHQMPIYHGPADEVVQRTAEDFENQADYETYMDENKKFEREYIESRLTRGVQELANYKIYPLAFEAPHYTMSQHGYDVVSDMFSTYVGQIQLSDDRWEIMNTAPYASKPTILNGMQLLPETIGFVQPEEDAPVEVMMDAASEYQVTDGGMIGAFYHPYLGVEGLKELLDEMETIEDIAWIDLKQMENTVAVDNVKISSGNGEIQADVDYLGLMTTSLDFPFYYLGQTVIVLTWIIAGIGILSVLMFVSFTVHQGIRRRRLERQMSKTPQNRV